MAGSSSLNKALSNSASANSVGQYSTSEVADLVGLKATQVRHYVRRDLLSPLRGDRGEFRFSFQDVVMLRSAKVLLDADVPVRRANRVLLDLKARNAEASRPLSSMRVQAEGTRVVVQEGNQAWDAESGQGTLPFLFDDSTETKDSVAANKVATLSVLGMGSESDLAPGGFGSGSGAGSIDGATEHDPHDLHNLDGFADLKDLDEFASYLSQVSELTDKTGPEAESQGAPSGDLGAGLGAGDSNSPSGSHTGNHSGRENEFGALTGPVEQDRRDAALKLLETLRSAGLTRQTNTETPESLADLESPDSKLVSVSEANRLTSDDWYNLALDLEEADPDKAPAAYRQALALNPQNTDAQVNLGRLCQLRGNLKQARRHYKLALVHAPEHQLANYNMGTIYDELDEFDTARDYYAHAKDIPDAHYNLARLFEVRGDELAALRHMREYRRLLEVDISGR